MKEIVREKREWMMHFVDPMATEADSRKKIMAHCSALGLERAPNGGGGPSVREGGRGRKRGGGLLWS